MDELFGDVWDRAGLTPRRSSGFSPRVDVYYCGLARSSDEAPRAVIKVDLPGVDMSDISLEISGRRLVISGERPVQETEGRVYEQLEIATGPFRRVVELSAPVDAEQAGATYADGILRIELPLLREGARTRRVPIERTED